MKAYILYHSISLSLKTSKTEMRVTDMSCYHFDWGAVTEKRTVGGGSFSFYLAGDKTSTYLCKNSSRCALTICAFCCMYVILQ